MVHLVRHGEVENPARVLYGRLPGFPLSERGRAMAEVVGASLAELDVAVVVSSPLQRARETAAAIATACRQEVRVDDRLTESGNLMQGRRISPTSLWDPRIWWLLRNPFTPSWGEHYCLVAARMLAACAAAADAAAGRHAVLVSHQLPIWVARRQLEGRRLWHRPDRRLCDLASVTSLHYEGLRVVAVGYIDPAASLRRGCDPLVAGRAPAAHWQSPR